MPDITSHNAIEFRNVSLSFDDRQALIDVTFELRRGEMIFLTGESGAGKSALLLLAMGLLKPDSGKILIDDCEIEIASGVWPNGNIRLRIDIEFRMGI